MRNNRIQTSARVLGPAIAVAMVAAGVVATATPAAAATSWTTPVALYTPAGGNAGIGPTISADGNAVAFGIRGAGFAYVQANVVERVGGTWGSATQLSGTSNGAWADPVAIAEDGTAAVWDFSDNAGEAIAGPNGNKIVAGNWQPAASPTEFAAGTYAEQARVDDSGTTVAWRSVGNVRTTTWDSAGAPGTITVVNDDGRTAYNVELSGDGQTILFNQDTDSDTHAFVARKSGGSWTRTDISGGIDSEDIFGISEDGRKAVFRNAENGHAMGTVFDGTNWSTPVDISGVQVEDYDQYYFVTADGSFVFQDMDGDDEGTVALFRDGAWLAPEIVAPDVGSVRGSRDGTVLAFVSEDKVITRTLNGTTWEPAVEHSGAGEFPTAAEISQDGCSVTWALSTGLVAASHSVQACSTPAPTAAQASKTSAKVDWEPAPEGVNPTTSYEVETYDGDTKVDPSCTVSTPLPDPLTCTVEGLTTGKTYTFRVRAVSSDGNGPWSAASNAVTLHDDSPPVPPAPPVSHALTLAAGKVTGKAPKAKVNLKGTTKKAKVTVYIYRAQKRGGVAQLVATTKSKAHTFSKKKVSLGGRSTAFFCAREKSKFSNLVKVTAPRAAQAARGDIVRCPR